MSVPIYFDYNATTPIDPQVAEIMLPFIHEHFGNPSSAHFYGKRTHEAIEKARQQIAWMLDCSTKEVVFTSGGTESNNHAIKGIAFHRQEQGNHIITSAIEHPAVLEVCSYLEKKGFSVTRLPVDSAGLIDCIQLEGAITSKTILISIMHANNEVGSIQPIAEISRIAGKYGIPVHSDCAQSVGKIPVHVDELGVDLLSIAGHKLYSPKGIGVLYIRDGVSLEKFMHGANHERNLRAGTENVCEIVGLGKACELIHHNLVNYRDHMLGLRDRFERGLKRVVPDIRINGPEIERLPNTTSVSFRNKEANVILAALTDVAVSAGAACHSDGVNVSHVLEAMHVPLEYAMGTLRFSCGRFSSESEIDKAIASITHVLSQY